MFFKKIRDNIGSFRHSYITEDEKFIILAAKNAALKKAVKDD